MKNNINSVKITVKVSGSLFSNESIADFKETNYYKRHNENGLLDNGDGNYDVDSFDKDINVIRYLSFLIMSGDVDLNEQEIIHEIVERVK
tara:strand:- start:1278 stop:1547 length:270 start_codon:yes stop_codon:yes gene_type:complete